MARYTVLRMAVLLLATATSKTGATDTGIPESTQLRGSLFSNNSRQPLAAFDFCPAAPPQANSRCRIAGERCEYSYTFTGCSWDALACIPTRICTCYEGQDTDMGATVNTWFCALRAVRPCSSTSTTGAGIAISEGPPVGDCDSDAALPVPPTNSTIDETENGNNEEEEQTSSCPISSVSSGICRDSQIGTSCQYNYIHSGCSWEDLQCIWTTSCECYGDPTTGQASWLCMARYIAPCSGINNGREIDIFDGGSNNATSINATDGDFLDGDFPGDQIVPEGLPWGDSCDPNEDLPQPPQPSAIGQTNLTRPPIVEGRLSEECPASPEYGSNCVDSYMANLQCEYDHIFTGCSWEAISCTPVVECECDKFEDEKWACLSMAMMPCETKPEGHPFGQYCDPELPLPVPRTANGVESPLMEDIMVGAMP